MEMSSEEKGGGGGGRGVFLSAHRCPEVDLLPPHNSETQIPLLSSQAPEFTCTGASDADYLDVSSRSEEEVEAEEEEEGSISDWSEEDLSLHFSPSVIIPSDDEESEIDSSCFDITVETQVTGHEGDGLKMVPKRQIQLKKKNDTENITDQEKTEKLQAQVILQDGHTDGQGANSEVSTNELLGPTVRHRPDLLLRQHSMPASFHTRSTTSGDVDSHRAYKGLVAGASQGFQVGGNTEAPRRLQKSYSLDESKTKMASCIIKSVLSKKMQVEQSNTNTSYMKKKPEVLSVLPPSADPQKGKDGGGGVGGVCKASVHVVRDMRSLVKNTYSLSFSTAMPDNHRPTSFKVIGQEDSPPPTYQQAVGVKSHQRTKTNSSKGHVAKITASLSQSHDRKQNNTVTHQVTQQRRGSEPIISSQKMDDVTNTPLVSQSETTRDVSHTFQPPSAPPNAPPTPRRPQVTQELRSDSGVSSQSGPGSSKQVLHSCFYPSPTLQPHLGKVSYIQSPLNYMQTQAAPPAPTLHLLRRSEENQKRPECFIKTTTSQQTRNTEDREGHVKVETSTKQTQEQHPVQQQPFLCSMQNFLPAQVGGDFLVDVNGSAVPTVLSGPAPCHMLIDPKSGQCYYVNMPPQPQRKMLLDPETGQFIQVFLPAASSTSNATVFPVCCATPTPSMINHAPTMLQVGGGNPTVLSVMRLQPTMAIPTLYAPPCLPFTLHTPSAP